MELIVYSDAKVQVSGDKIVVENGFVRIRRNRIEVYNGLNTCIDGSTRIAPGRGLYKAAPGAPPETPHVTEACIPAGSHIYKIRVVTHGSVNVGADAPLADTLALAISGAGRIQLHGGQFDSINAEITGPGHIRAWAKTEVACADFRVDGSGRISGFVVSREVKTCVKKNGVVDMSALSGVRCLEARDNQGKIDYKKI